MAAIAYQLFTELRVKIGVALLIELAVEGLSTSDCTFRARKDGEYATCVSSDFTATEITPLCAQKEIHEQPESILQTMSGRVNLTGSHKVCTSSSSPLESQTLEPHFYRAWYRICAVNLDK